MFMSARGVGMFAWILFGIGVVMLGLMLAAPRLRPRNTDRVRMPALAVEFVDSDAALHRIIGAPGNSDPVAVALRKRLAGSIKGDYAFIVLYTLLFVGIAAVLWRHGGDGWAPVVAGAAVVTALAAAGFDVVENRRMTVVLEEVSLVRDVATPGFLKWLFSFMTLALLSFTFFGRGGWGTAAGVACLAVAALGWVGLAMIRAGMRETLPIELAFALMLFVLLPLVGLALRAKGAFPPG